MSETHKPLTVSSMLPILLAIAVQTGTAVWWASAMQQSVDSIQHDFTEFVDEHDAENLRQWARINDNESEIAAIASAVNGLTIRLAAMSETLDGLRIDLRKNNDLLREFLTQQATHGR